MVEVSLRDGRPISVRDPFGALQPRSSEKAISTLTGAFA
jgi:hypothetical protein